MPLNGGIVCQATGPQKDQLQLVHNWSFWFLANWATGNWTDHNWSQLATAVRLWSVAVQSSCQSLHQLPTGLRNTTSDLLAAVTNNPDAGTRRITQDLYSMLSGGYIHPITVDKLWKCIHQVDGYESDHWKAILVKCGIDKSRWPGLLEIMTLTSQDHQKLM